MAEAREVVASAARTTSGDSGPLSIMGSAGETLSLLVNVTATGGTPSMAVTVEWSHNGTDFAIAEPADSHGAAITAVVKRVKAYAIKGPVYRVVWAITGGTPSLTFSVSEHTTT